MLYADIISFFERRKCQKKSEEPMNIVTFEREYLHIF